MESDNKGLVQRDVHDKLRRQLETATSRNNELDRELAAKSAAAERAQTESGRAVDEADELRAQNVAIAVTPC